MKVNTLKKRFVRKLDDTFFHLFKLFVVKQFFVVKQILNQTLRVTKSAFPNFYLSTLTFFLKIETQVAKFGIGEKERKAAR